MPRRPGRVIVTLAYELNGAVEIETFFVMCESHKGEDSELAMAGAIREVIELHFIVEERSKEDE
jgi:hypothetical protein